MARDVLLGLDFGGGGVRCLALDARSRATWCEHRALAPLPAEPAGLGFALDLAGAERALADAVRACLARAGASARDVRGIACTSQRHTTVALDARGEVLLAAPNRDARAAGEGLRLAAEHGEALAARTGHWPLPIFTAARLLWMRAQAADAFARVAKVASLSEWMALRLCGELATDPTQAGETLLFDLATRSWSDDALARLGLARALFADVAEPGARLGALSDGAARALGLAPGTPVAAGVADTQAALLACGALAPGATAVVAGTTMPLQRAIASREPDPDARLWTGQHALPGLRVRESNAGPAGEALAWMAELLCGDAPTAVPALLALARGAAPGAGGALSTVGASVMDARAQGLPFATLGFSPLALPRAGARAALARAALEGLACAIRANLDQLDALDPPANASDGEPRAIALTGGLARSATFAQVVADVADRAVDVAACREGSALGAALCAAVGAGLCASLDEAARTLVAPPARIAPRAELRDVHAELRAAWQRQRTARAGADAEAAGRAIAALLAGARRAPAAAAPERAPHILVTADLAPSGVERFAALGELEYASYRDAKRMLSGAALVDAAREADVLVTEIDVVAADAVAALPRLRVVASCRGDAVNVDVAACTLHGIPVLNAPGRNADAVADLAVAFALLLARRLPGATAFLRSGDVVAGDFGKMGQAFAAFRGRELSGLAIGLVGLGAVGRKVAERLRGFGGRVLATDPFADAEQAALVGAELVALDELLARADVVSLHAPVTDATRGLVDAAAIARMKPGAMLVNTARAALVDEDALADALERGHLGGAALDVFGVEPPGADHPLLRAPNVIATPHIGGNAVEVAAHQGAIIGADLERLLRGERPLHCLNPEVLDGFDWRAPRRTPSAAELEALRDAPPPAVTDLARDAKRAAPATRAAKPGAAATTAGAPPAAAAPSLPGDVLAALDRALDRFVAAIERDAAFAAAARSADATLAFRLTDADRRFAIALAGGVRAAVGEPPTPPDVELRLRAATLDGMFTGRLDAMSAAMQGDISFTGDATRAMALQQLQADLERLWREARAADAAALDRLAEGAPA